AARVSFEIAYDKDVLGKTVYLVTKIPGYAGNATAAHFDITSPNKDEDFSFSRDVNQEVANPNDVKVEADKTWVTFWAKDYGGEATVWARLLDAAGKELHTFELTVPVDANGDKVADFLEQQTAYEMQTKYGWATPPNWRYFLKDREGLKWEDYDE